MEDCLKALCQQDSWFKEHSPTIEWFGGRWLPGSVENDHPLMECLTQSFIEVKHQPPIIEASPWGTDGGILSSVSNTPVVVFGPGVTEVAHHSNEYIVLEDMFAAAEIIAYCLLDWCGVAE
jgi:acetylornithine deacetylase